MKRLGLVVSAFMVTLGTAPLCAQGTGTIRGRVSANNSEQGLAGVLVTFRNRSVYTREDGAYLMSGISPGADTLRAKVLGYAPAKRALTVASGQTVNGDI